MSLSKESADAMRECIRILAPLYDAAKRKQMALNAESYIQKGKWIPAFTRKQIPPLFYPTNQAKADALRALMDEAIKAGELHVLESNDGFLPSHLAGWPDCPSVPLDSPLRFWLPESMHERSLGNVDQAVTPAIVRYLEVHEARPIPFGELPHMMANAMWPDRGNADNRMSYGVARVNLEAELKQSVLDGRLTVRNASTLKKEVQLFGEGLERSVVLPIDDLAPFLRERGGIELHLIPYGSGPTHWTIENASSAIAEQEGWHAGSRDALKKRMTNAAMSGELTVRDPQTDLPYRPDRVRDFWDLVSPLDVNAWLQSQGVLYRWNLRARLEAKDTFRKFDPLQRYADEASNNEYTLAWWDLTLNASRWWGYSSVKPKEAALLLCGLDPHDPTSNGELLATEGEPNAMDYRSMLRGFEDAALDGNARTLRQWVDIAAGQRLKHHSWIDEWIAAVPQGESEAPSSDHTNIAKPLQRSAAHDSNVLTALRSLGFDPKRLPKAPPGKPSEAKTAAKSALPGMSNEVFRKTWQRLRNTGEIADA
jgi:hypothetical protein